MPADCEIAGSGRRRYAAVKVGGRSIGAHRIAYERAHGPIPPGMVVMHTCDNPPCVNPDHLRAGTQAENIADMMAKGRHHRLRGETAPGRKLTQRQVDAIRTDPRSQAIIAADYGVTQSAISRIKTNRRWRAA